MAFRSGWDWVLRDFGRGFAGLDASKLMIAPILFVGLLALLDRAVYEIDRSISPEMPERATRLSAADGLPLLAALAQYHSRPS